MGSTGPAKMYAFDLRTGKLKWQSKDTVVQLLPLLQP